MISLMEKWMDSFIWGEGSVSRKQLEKLVKMGMPAAAFKTGIQVDGVIEADIDNVKAAYERHQLSHRLGHRRIVSFNRKMEQL